MKKSISNKKGKNHQKQRACESKVNMKIINYES